MIVQTDQPSAALSAEIAASLEVLDDTLKQSGCDLTLALDGDVRAAPTTWPSIFSTSVGSDGKPIQTSTALPTTRTEPASIQAQFHVTPILLGHLGSAPSDAALTCEGQFTLAPNSSDVAECTTRRSEAASLQVTSDAKQTAALMLRGLRHLAGLSPASGNILQHSQCIAIKSWLLAHAGAHAAIAGNLAKQDALLAEWRKRAFRCGPTGYPTKEWDNKAVSTETGSNCNDGDMLLFSGLLCSVGEESGCDEVRLSQNRKTWQWWRSPNVLARNMDTVTEPNLNSDQALGAMLYALRKGDGLQFRRWTNWIASRGPCTALICLGSRLSIPRYCSLGGEDGGNCIFKFVDCPLLTLVGGELGEQLSTATVCNLAQWLGIPNVLQPDPRGALSQYRAAYNLVGDLENKVTDLYKQLKFNPPPLPPLPLNPDVLDAAFKPLADEFATARNDLEELIKLPDLGGLAVAYGTAEAAVVANANVAGLDLKKGKPGHEGKDASGRHLAGVALLILKEFRLDDPLLKSAGAKLLDAEPANPFFEYLAHGANDRMINLIVDQCPALDFDLPNKVPRFQWAWERDDSRDAGRQSMFWDCVFIMDLYRGRLQHITLSDIGQNLLPKVDDIKKILEDDTKQALDLQGQINNQKALADALVNDLQNQLNYLKSILENVAKGAIPQYDPATGKVTLNPPPGTPGPPVSIDIHNGNINAGPICIGFHC
ncbi:hypothetical protein SAMN05444171_3858 [Bradyrhizobium lablabi]|uniref:Uncharacterized protein n=2 Tax=Bradyrhizobium TaxID=374 RepID=A0ABY0PP92_9BRAD|nr:hypothetical protein SAMN05444163_3310 [Bradyrhizobium ottawaense]SED34428.1 hypothetical protein SAMN05444171_3858 [Bradyrhizobium lablabi]